MLDYAAIRRITDKLRFVHSFIALDYEHNCSVIFKPQSGYEPLVTCLTEAEEGFWIVRLGLAKSTEYISDEANNEWTYFWMDRNGGHIDWRKGENDATI